MKDCSDWDFILNCTDELFYRLALSVACRSNISLADAHEESWVLFEQGAFRLQCGDDESEFAIVPSHSEEDRRAAMKQNKPLADYRRRVIEAAVEGTCMEGRGRVTLH